MPLTSHVARSLVRFWLKCLTDNAAFGAFDTDFWRKAAYLAHKSLAEEGLVSRRIELPYLCSHQQFTFRAKCNALLSLESFTED